MLFTYKLYANIGVELRVIENLGNFENFDVGRVTSNMLCSGGTPRIFMRHVDFGITKTDPHCAESVEIQSTCNGELKAVTQINRSRNRNIVSMADSPSGDASHIEERSSEGRGA